MSKTPIMDNARQKMFDKLLEAVPNLKEHNHEIPRCLISIDIQCNAHLIKILNESKVDPSWEAYLPDEIAEMTQVDDMTPGVYEVDIHTRSWQDNTPNSNDWNSESWFENIKQVELPKGDKVWEPASLQIINLGRQ